MESSLLRLKTIFAKMVEDGFDVKNYLKWGFYFFDLDKTKLSILSKELQLHGYKYENLLHMDDKYWRLFVSSIDVLSPEELHKKNIFFNKLASQHNVELYDGWDVEKLHNV